MQSDQLRDRCRNPVIADGGSDQGDNSGKVLKSGQLWDIV